MGIQTAAERLDLIRDFDLSNLCDTNGNGVNLIICVKSWVALLLASPIKSFKSDSLLRRELRFMRDKYSHAVDTYARLADLLANSVVQDDFGTMFVSLHREFFSTPVFAEYCSWFKDGNADTYQFLLSYLLFAKKAVYKNPDLIEKSHQNWIKNEERIGKVVTPAFIVSDLRDIVAKSGFYIDPWDMVFKHGPGTVSEKKVRTLSQKCAGVRYAPELEGFIGLMRRDGLSNFPVESIIPDVEIWDKGSRNPRMASTSVAEELVVPKDKGSVRVIFRETTSHMFFQQGMFAAMDAGLKRSSYGAITDVHDQTRNRVSCRFASEDGEYSTLDLSWASDSVAKTLMNMILPDQTLEYLYASRTASVRLMDGRVQTTNRIGGMGAAWTFTTQCLVFSTFVMLANTLGRRGIHISEYLKGELPIGGQPIVHAHDCVFGDDIICLANQTEALISLLTISGFVVNEAKSFFGARVLRESCGEYWLGGKNVTPLRFKVKGLENGDLNLVYGMIDFANRAFQLGYYSLRDLVVSFIPRHRYIEVEEDFPHKGPCYVYELFVDRSSYSYRELDKDKRPMVSQKQIAVWKAIDLVSGVVTHQMQRYQYNKWSQSPSISEGSKPPIGDTGKTVLRRVWMPA